MYQTVAAAASGLIVTLTNAAGAAFATMYGDVPADAQWSNVSLFGVVTYASSGSCSLKIVDAAQQTNVAADLGRLFAVRIA